MPKLGSHSPTAHTLSQALPLQRSRFCGQCSPQCHHRAVGRSRATSGVGTAELLATRAHSEAMDDEVVPVLSCIMVSLLASLPLPCCCCQQCSPSAPE